jgi:hypothetical protein
MREKLDVCDREFGKVLAHIIFSELRRQAADEDA